MQITTSVVIPTYRPTGHLCAAIESVLAQDLRDAEILLVDDASPAECQAFLDGCAARYPLRLIRRPANGGPAAGHNTGIQAAAGEYVAFLEHDDVFLPGKLTRQIDALREHRHWGACYSGCVVIDGEGKTVEHPPMLYLEGEAAQRRMLAGDFIWSLSSVVARRACLLEAGGMDETFRIAHDYDLWLRIVLGRWEIGCVPERLLSYRRHEGNLSAHNKSRCILETARALEKARDARPDLWPLGVKHYARSWYRLGRQHLQDGDVASARACFRHAFTAAPLYWKAYVRWAVTSLHRADSES